MRIVKKITIIACLLFLNNCTNKSKVLTESPPPPPTGPLGKLRGDWIAINEEDLVDFPQQNSVIVFDENGFCKFPGSDPLIPLVTLTPLKEVHFQDKPKYVAYIYKRYYEFKENDTELNAEDYIILWSDEISLRMSGHTTDLDNLLAYTEVMNTTDEHIQNLFASKAL